MKPQKKWLILLASITGLCSSAWFLQSRLPRKTLTPVFLETESAREKLNRRLLDKANHKESFIKNRNNATRTETEGPVE